MLKQANQKDVTVETFGMSQREFLTLFLLNELKHGPNYPRALHIKLKENYSGKIHSYDYLCKIAKELAQTEVLSFVKEGGKNVFSITEKGQELYNWYIDNFKERLLEVKMVIDRFVYDLTGSGENPPVEHELPEGHRKYFSKLVSVMDLVRYVTLKAASNRTTIYMGEIGELLKMKYGWVASNSYLYDLSSEMERNNLLIGAWEDSEKRTKRILRLTDEGVTHYRQIADAAAERVVDVKKYLNQVLSLL